MKLTSKNKKILEELVAASTRGMTNPAEIAKKEEEITRIFTEVATKSLKSSYTGSAERIIEKITNETVDPKELRKKIAEVRAKEFIAREKTTVGKSILFQGLFGESLGKRLSAKFAKADPSKVQEAMDFIKNIEKQSKAASRKKEEQFYDIGIGEGVVQTGGTAQVKKRKADRLSKMIYADETWEVKATELLESLLKSTGKYQSRHQANEFGSIHEKLRWIIENCCDKCCASLPVSIPVPNRPGLPPAPMPQRVPIPERIPIPLPRQRVPVPERVPLPIPERTPLPVPERAPPLPVPERVPLPAPERTPTPLPAPKPTRPIPLPKPDDRDDILKRVPERFKKDKIGRLPPIDVTPLPSKLPPGSEKAAEKIAAKAAGKSLLKKIPGVGLITGLGLGAQRALSGDLKGAALEVASGIAGTVPGIGTAGSLAIDAALAARDMSADTGQAVTNASAKTSATLDSIKSDTSTIVRTLGGKPTTTTPTTTSSTRPTTKPPEVKTTVPPPEKGFFESTYDKISSAATEAFTGVKSFLGVGTSAGELEKYVKKADSSVDLNGLNPKLKERLAGLAKEYYEKTGQKLQINSGYRSPEKQAELYAKFGPPKAAPPGSSRHESGLAVDINSADANKAAQLGLMAKYGFSRPVSGEAWHVEPVETARKGGTPDNPFTPGAPVVVASRGDKPITPNSGKRPPAQLTAQSGGASASIGETTSSVGSTSSTSAMTTSASATSGGGASFNFGDASGSTGGEISGGAPSYTATNITPVQNTLGQTAVQESNELATNQMVAQATPPAAPVIINNSGGQKPAGQAPPSQPAPKASPYPTENAFNRAMSRDFAHPTAFTSVSFV